VPLEDGIDEIALAAALDAYPRTFAARSASTTPGRRAVRSRHGLVLVPSRPEEPARGDDIVLTPTLEASGDPAFDRVLTAVARDFGGRTAALVADQLEYPAAGLRLDAHPTPLAGLLVRLALLLAVGAAAGFAVRSAWRRRRRIAARATALILALAASPPGLAGCGGPLGPLAGGRLSGTVAEHPVADWSFAAQQTGIAGEPSFARMRACGCGSATACTRRGSFRSRPRGSSGRPARLSGRAVLRLTRQRRSCARSGAPNAARACRR
jgi:hypothetical protein